MASTLCAAAQTANATAARGGGALHMAPATTMRGPPTDGIASVFGCAHVTGNTAMHWTGRNTVSVSYMASDAHDKEAMFKTTVLYEASS